MLSETIKNRLVKRFSAPLPEFYERRIVFWRDEDREFEEELEEVELPDVTVVKLTGRNNFAVKKLLTADDLVSDFLIYDPLSYEADGHDDWLLDIRLYSEEFRADLISMQMEELRVEPTTEMRKTMRKYAKFFSKARKEKLKSIGNSYKSSMALEFDIIAVLCGLNGGSFQDILIAFLSNGLDREGNTALENIEKFGDPESFWEYVYRATGYQDREEKPLTDLASHILLTALGQTMNLNALKGLERYISETNITFCYQLVHEWQRSEKREKLFEICRVVEGEQRLNGRFGQMDISELRKSDIFPAIDESILTQYFNEISENVIKAEEIRGVVESRRTTSWYEFTQEYYESLYYISKMQSFYLAHIDGFPVVEARKIWENYQSDYYKMDTYYRHFHLHYGKTQTASNLQLDDLLKRCIPTVEGLYSETFLRPLTESWTSAIASDLETAGYITRLKQQVKFYDQFIAPTVDKSKIYVVISDALRYEVADELKDALNQTKNGQASLEAIQGIFPSITKFGMAALLPARSVEVGSKMEVTADGLPTVGTSAREAVLKEMVPESVAITYKELLRISMREKRDLVNGKNLVYIYHNRIDAVGDKASTESEIFEACEDAISDLVNVVRIISNEMNGTSIYITADHGFLYTYQPLEESQKISRQTFDGEIYELGRRYALVAPETQADYLLPVNTSRVIGGLPLKGYAPREMVRIKVQGGGANYVHGGISLQELTVPVITYKRVRTTSKNYVELQNSGLSLLSQNHKVSNMIFSLDFLQKLPVGEKVSASTYELVFKDEEGKPVSDVQYVIADRTSSSDADRVFRVKFTLKQLQYNKNKTYHLVISNGVDVPEEVEFRIDIAFAGDFGFGF